MRLEKSGVLKGNRLVCLRECVFEKKLKDKHFISDLIDVAGLQYEAKEDAISLSKKLSH